MHFQCDENVDHVTKLFSVHVFGDIIILRCLLRQKDCILISHYIPIS